MSSTTPKSLLLSKEGYKTKAVYRKARVLSSVVSYLASRLLRIRRTDWPLN